MNALANGDGGNSKPMSDNNKPPSEIWILRFSLLIPVHQMLV